MWSWITNLWTLLTGDKDQAAVDQAAYERFVEEVKPADGWANEETTEERLAALPDTTDGRRPQTLDDVVESVGREVTGSDLQARLSTAIWRVHLMARLGVDPRRLWGRQFLGSLVPTFRQHVSAGSEQGRLLSGLPGRN